MLQVAALCGGNLRGGAVGSGSVSLTPGALTGGCHTADTRTAGSCMLLAQARHRRRLVATVLKKILRVPLASMPHQGGWGWLCRDMGHVGPGSCSTAVQAALPCLLMAGPGESAAGSALPADDAPQPISSVRSVLRLRGGTDASMAPPVGYAQHVLLPLLRRKLGVDVSLDIVRRGFFPKARRWKPPFSLCTHPVVKDLA